MRILHTESSLGWGGQEIRILTEAAGMRTRGHDVAVACPPHAPLHAEAARYGVPVHSLALDRKRPRGVAALRRLLREHAFDAINAHSSTDAWLVAVTSLSLKSAPAMVRTRHISAPVSRDRLTRWLYTRATAQTVTTGDAIRAALIRDIGVAPDRVTSIPTGIDATRFPQLDKRAARRALDLPEDAPIIGICATLRSWKGHRFLIDAMALLSHRDAQLVIVGDGPQRAALAQQIAALGLGGRVQLPGHQRDVAPWLAAFDVFALPSFANEGVPQALVQAMFAGVPCVTTDAGAIGEVALGEHTALVIPQQNALALAAAIDRVLGDHALAATLTREARARVASKFSLSSMLDKMERVFLRAIDEHPRRA
ncbi:MAG: glycosyltransferase family 4 protein [Betaproteobacteria bacterium]